MPAEISHGSDPCIPCPERTGEWTIVQRNTFFSTYNMNYDLDRLAYKTFT